MPTQLPAACASKTLAPPPMLLQLRAGWCGHQPGGWTHGSAVRAGWVLMENPNECLHA